MNNSIFLMHYKSNKIAIDILLLKYIKNDELYIKGDNINITTNNKDKSVILTGLDKETENNLNIINNNNIQKNELKEKNEKEKNKEWNINLSIGDNISGTLKNTTLTYKDSDGYDFSASPASIAAGTLATVEIIQSTRQGINELFKLTTGHDLNENKNLDKIIDTKTKDDVIGGGTYETLTGKEKQYGYVDSGKTDSKGNKILIMVNVNEDGSLSKYEGAVYREDNGDHYGVKKVIDNQTYIIIGFNTVGMANVPDKELLESERNVLKGTPVIPDGFKSIFNEGSWLLNNPIMRILNTDLVSKPHDTWANNFNDLGNNLFGKGTTGSKIVQKGLTFPTALSVFIAPLLTYGMPDGGYKYGDTVKKYNDIVGNAKVNNNIINSNNNHNSSSIITKIKGNESDNKTNSYTEYLIKLLEVSKNEKN